jgi:hypothetical protein
MEKIKQKINDVFKKSSKFELIELYDIDVKEDPVRPELSVKFRISHGKKIYGLKDNNGEIMSVICLAFTNDVPTSVDELDIMCQDAAGPMALRGGLAGRIAVAYTVWSKKKGGGKHIINEIYKKFKGSHYIERLITLSPLTEMAEDFHIKNGAKLLKRNKTTQNFEYDITLEQWTSYLDRVKKFLKLNR